VRRSSADRCVRRRVGSGKRINAAPRHRENPIAARERVSFDRADFNCSIAFVNALAAVDNRLDHPDFAL
jgi:hypothetical protein